jgi:S1-C subfamily serine protease
MKKSLRKGLDLKVALTALVSAITGGLVATGLVYLGVLGLEEGPGHVTINEAPAVSSGGVDPGGGEGPSVREVYTNDGPGVVTVDVGSEEMGPGGGSGFAIADNGYVVTNQHVVEGANNVSVRFASGARGKAKVVGEDPSTDIAVIKVNAPEETLKPLTLGDSDSVGVGDPVIAIGNPLDVGISVTTGIISGLGRPIPAPNDYTIDGAVQTDAAINPGNSGGPLLDARGTVIGMNAQVLSDTGSFQGVGFAVPINTIKNVVQQLIEKGKVEHGYIGVRMFQVGVEELATYSDRSAGDLSGKYGLPEKGAIVSQATEGGPAEGAGIKGGERTEEIAGLQVPIGDVVTEAEGEPVSTPDDLIKVVNSLKPGDDLNLTVVTPGEAARDVKVSVDTRPNEQ